MKSRSQNQKLLLLKLPLLKGRSAFTQQAGQKAHLINMPTTKAGDLGYI
jgi:hypothetical protein